MNIEPWYPDGEKTKELYSKYLSRIKSGRRMSESQKRTLEKLDCAWEENEARKVSDEFVWGHMKPFCNETIRYESFLFGVCTGIGFATLVFVVWAIFL